MQYIGEIRMFAGNFAPQSWLFCDGSLQPIAVYSDLFTLIGTIYGGDGQETFGLPDLRGRGPMHQSSLHPIGEMGGVETVQLTTLQMPQHNHALRAVNGPATTRSPAAAYLAEPARDLYAPAAALQSFDTTTVVGNSVAHENMMPFLTINFIIAYAGVFPTS